MLLQRYDERVQEQELFGYQEQIDFIDEQLKNLMKERQKFEAAYQRDIYTLDEFEEKMLNIRQQYETFKKIQGNLPRKTREKPQC